MQSDWSQLSVPDRMSMCDPIISLRRMTVCTFRSYCMAIFYSVVHESIKTFFQDAAFNFTYNNKVHTAMKYIKYLNCVYAW